MNSSPSSSDAQAARNPPRGCLRRYQLLPLTVILVGSLLYWGLSKVEIDQAQTSPPPQSSLESSPGGIAPLFTPEVQAWEAKILSWADKYQLDPNLVATVMQIESCGFAQAKSGAGAMGLFQVMPYHFQDGEDPFSPGVNAKRGLVYLRTAQEAAQGSPNLTLAGYNGGITGAQQPRESWNAEMGRYVYWGVQIYQDAKAGLDQSPRLQEWLGSGGDHLCRLAKNQ